MRHLWAPWRDAYVTKEPRGCFICTALRLKRDREHWVLKRTKHSLCMLNLYPYNAGHLLIVPKRHVKDLENLSSDERLDLIDLLIDMQKVSRKALKAHGFNAGVNFGRAAGAGLLGHVHIHLVPRWNGDTNFLPVISDTKTVSSSLNLMYQRITRAMARRGRK